MKSIAALATFVVLSLYFNKTQPTPALRNLRSQEDADEMINEHHHHIRKVKKIAIPVPVGVPQYIPIPISVPSSIIASSNTAVVNSPTTIGINPVGAVGGAPGVPQSPVVTPAPTTMTGRPVATPAPTTTQRSSATPAPTNVNIDQSSGTQQPMSRTFSSTNIPSGFDPLSTTNGFPPNVGGGFGGNPMTGFGRIQLGANRFDGRNFGLARNNRLTTGDQVGVGGFNRRERRR